MTDKMEEPTKVYIFVYNVRQIKFDVTKIKKINADQKFILIASTHCLHGLSTRNRSCFDAIHQIKRNFHKIDVTYIGNVVSNCVDKYGANNIRILTNEDSTQIGCAHAREIYGIPGETVESITPFVNKLIAKKLLNSVVKTPQFIEFDKIKYLQKRDDYLNEVVETLNFPMFIKPIDVVGSIESYRINDFYELQKTVNRALTLPYEFEVDEFIDGVLFYCDLVVIDNELKFFIAGKYTLPLAEFSNGKPIGSIMVTDEDLLGRFRAFSNKILKQLKIIRGVYHLEIFLANKYEELVFLNIASRTAEALILRVYEIQLGINLEELKYLLSMGNLNNLEISSENKFAAWFIFPKQAGTVIEVEKPNLNVQYEFLKFVEVGDVIHSAELYVEVAASLVFWDDSPEKIQQIFEQLNTYKPIKTVNQINLSSIQLAKLGLNLESHFEIMEELFNVMPFVFWKDRAGRYLGCNLNQAKAFNINSISEFIGKSTFEVLEDYDSAKLIDETDNQIMRNGISVILEETLSTPYGIKTYLSQKQPIRDESGHVAGMLGFSMDITEIKAQQIKAEEENQRLLVEKYQLELENDRKLKFSQQQEEFRKIVERVAHDLGSPLMVLNALLPDCALLPEVQRDILRRAVTRIRDISSHMLNQFRSNKEANHSQISNTLICTEILEIVTEKRYEYAEFAVNFITHITQGWHFSFINTNANAFKRMLSNIINNAVDALKDKSGEINIYLDILEDSQVQIIIEDNGCGMPSSVKEKIINKVTFTSGKSDGHGIGYGQIHDTLAASNGQLSVESEPGKGTKIILTFPAIDKPAWICSKLELTPDDLVIILDDDPSIHSSWEVRLKKHVPNIRLEHFVDGTKTVDFINKLVPEKREKVFLLTDYELLRQEVNGLDVIKLTGINRSVLVTSHYNSFDLRDQVIALNSSTLPKPIASEVPILVYGNSRSQK